MREPIEIVHRLPSLTVNTFRSPVTFNLRDCFRAAFMVGAGLTTGIITVVSVAWTASAIVRAVFS